MRILAAAVIFLIAAGSASAEALAVVNERELTWENLVGLLGGPEVVASLGITTTEAANEVLESWVREQLILEAAEDSGIIDNPEVAAAIENAVNQILLEAYINEAIADVEISRLEVENYVDVWGDTYNTEYNIRHILLPDMALASSVLSRLNGGESFATLATQFSTGPSGPSGGNLGWVSRGMVTPQFMEAVCQLETGEISSVIETPMGYHIMQLLEKRPLQNTLTQADIIELATMELVSAEQEILIVEMLDDLRTVYTVNTWPERLLNHI
ncbi:hypothetical protein CSA37_06110 [Candidatus Fermentibacteria bacterium]|nr:MAG: hypothetical protein CSA37_06110 [Candidatus Fermentibacteria bacterium]